MQTKKKRKDGRKMSWELEERRRGEGGSIQDGKKKRSERGRRWSPLTILSSVTNFKPGFGDGQVPTSRGLYSMEWMAGIFPTEGVLIIGG